VNFASRFKRNDACGRRQLVNRSAGILPAVFRAAAENKIAGKMPELRLQSRCSTGSRYLTHP
jgi:hypothetical protein